MRKPLVSALSLLGTVLAIALHAAPVQAQASRTWVSGVGDDVNPCSRTAPCKTFAGAISKTALNGEINCLDPAGYGTVTITKSITIDCKNTHASLLHSVINGINIPFDNFLTAGETRKTVRIRGLAFNGFDNGTNGIRITGGLASTNTEVHIEDVVIDGSYAGTARGITDERSGGGKLFISNTVVRNVGGFGIGVLPTLSNALVNNVVIDNVRVFNATNHGLGIGFNVRAMVNRSVFSGNGAAGVYAEGGNSEMNVNGSVISNNSFGVQQNGAVMRLSDNDIAFNTAAQISGATSSHGNNRISGGNAGTAPTLLSPALQ